jgi:hypothetical protein
MFAEILVFDRTGVFVSMNTGSAPSHQDRCNAPAGCRGLRFGEIAVVWLTRVLLRSHKPDTVVRLRWRCSLPGETRGL